MMKTKTSNQPSASATGQVFGNTAHEASGGSAAIHGFLYQILAHLDWARKLGIESKNGGVNLTLEPIEGGDAIIQTSKRRIVEQYKSRAHDGSWSINEIVGGPFTDFMRVATTRTDNDEFRFVTNGKVDHQVAFGDFLKRLGSCNAHTDLDQVEMRKYRSIGVYSDRSLFDWVRSGVAPIRRQKKVLPDESVVFHMLSRAKLVGNVRESEIVTRIDSFLAHSIPDPQAAPTKRKELIGTLMHELARGELILDARCFLQSHGVDLDRAARLASLTTRLRGLFATTTTRGSHRYARQHDVRKAPEWNIAKKQILALSGRSGVGKTWQLVRLGYELTDQGLPCVLASIQGDTTRTLDIAARTVWNDALQTATVADISSVKQALRQLDMVTTTVPWLVVLIDGPMDHRNLELLVDYIARDREIRVALTLSPEVAQALQQNYPDLVELVNVEQFTETELSAFLDGFDIAWQELPEDLLNLLRLPLLANLYALAGSRSFTDSPSSEYEMFEALWKRSGTAGDTALATARHLRELARYANRYPDTATFQVERVLPTATSEDLASLARAGWIELASDSRIRFAHDRLLNWSLADVVAEDISSGDLQSGTLIEALHLPLVPGSRWGYVLMDVLWKLTSVTSRIGQAVAILPSIENALGFRADVFYESLLPTLGTRALDLIAAQLPELTANSHVHNLTRTVRKVGEQFAGSPITPALQSWMLERIRDPRRNVANLGLAFVEETGFSAIAGDVFKIQLEDAANLGTERSAYSNYELSFSALKACVRSNTSWLSQRIGSSRDSAELCALSFQLFNLESDEAPNIWSAHRSRFVRYTSREESRGVLSCIRRFVDTEYVAYVKNALLSSEDFVGATALGALVRINATEAIAVLEAVPRNTLLFARSLWFRNLHRAMPKETEKWLTDKFSDGSTFELYRIIERQAGAQCAQRAIDGFCHEVSQRVQVDLPWLGGWQKILPEMRYGAKLRAIGATTTESQLVEIAKRQIDATRSWYDHLLEDARFILIAIGGAGIQELLRDELHRTRGANSYRALRLCPMVPWDGIAHLLSTHVAVGVGPHNDDARTSNHYALVALAALGTEDELISAIRSSGSSDCPMEALDIRRGQNPFSAVAVQHIEHRLMSVDLTVDDMRRELALAALAQAPELRVPIAHAISTACDESVFTHGVVAALEYRPVSETLALSCVRWLQNEKTRLHAINLLLSCEAESAPANLLDLVRSIMAVNKDLAADIVARLPANGPIGDQANKLAIEIFNSAEYAVQCYERVARCGGPAEKEVLKRRAYKADTFFLDVRKAAIRALGLIDRSDAVEAAMWLVKQSSNFDEFAAVYVLYFGTDAQCISFIDSVGDIDRPTLWAHAGRALRRRDRASSTDLLEHYRRERGLFGRKTFASLAGWFGKVYQDEVEARIAQEHSPGVLKSLNAADIRISQLQTLEEHLAGLKVATGEHRLALLMACLAVNEPFLLSDPDDDCWIGRALEAHPKYFQVYAEEELSNRRRNWKAE